MINIALTAVIKTAVQMRGYWVLLLNGIYSSGGRQARKNDISRATGILRSFLFAQLESQVGIGGIAALQPLGLKNPRYEL